MANVFDLPAVPPFCVSDHRILAQRWEKWIKSLDYYICASLEKLHEYFPQKNIPFERHVFCRALQQPDESMDAFVTHLRELSKKLQF